MKFLIIGFLFIFGIFFSPLSADSTSNPVINPYGKIYANSKASFQPNKAIKTHRVIFNITKGAKSPKEVNPGLERVARTINLYASTGINPSSLKFVAVISGDATSSALNNDEYKSKYGVDNPNIDLIKQLKKLGVDVSMCFQAWNEHNFNQEWLDKNVNFSLSALTTMIYLQQKGYVLVPL